MSLSISCPKIPNLPFIISQQVGMYLPTYLVTYIGIELEQFLHLLCCYFHSLCCLFYKFPRPKQLMMMAHLKTSLMLFRRSSSVRSTHFYMWKSWLSLFKFFFSFYIFRVHYARHWVRIYIFTQWYAWHRYF